MPDLVEHMYSSQQITIPPSLPTVLKKYAKAAIRTQPRDLLVWSAAYFKALTYGIPLPMKESLEYPPVQTISGLSPGYLKILINQIGNSAIAVLRDDIKGHWKGICLSDEALEEIFDVGGFGLKLNWFKFIAICAGYLESNLTQTMVLLCELLTEEPSGGSAYIPINKFLYLYKYLARLDCGPNEPIKTPHPNKPNDQDLFAIEEPLSGEDISYKEAEDVSIKSVSEISWQSVLKRMGKRESDVSVCSLEQVYKNDNEQTLERGVAWQRITEIDESEPDTSDTLMQSECYDSSMGLQVFEYLEDKKLKKRLVDPKKIQEEEEGEKDLSRSESITDLKQLGQKSLDEILGLVQEFETKQKVKESEVTLENDEKEEWKSDSPPRQISPQGSEVDDISEKTNDEMRELVKPDSSMILVPTPPKFGDEEQSNNDDIEELPDDEEFSESLGLQVGAVSLHDVHVPNLEIPVLINIEEEIPKTYFHEQKWVHIPGIGPKVPEEQIKQVEIYMRECAEKQAGTVMPRNLRHFQCPSLDPISPETV